MTRASDAPCRCGHTAVDHHNLYAACIAKGCDCIRWTWDAPDRLAESEAAHAKAIREIVSLALVTLCNIPPDRRAILAGRWLDALTEISAETFDGTAVDLDRLDALAHGASASTIARHELHVDTIDAGSPKCQHHRCPDDAAVRVCWPGQTLRMCHPCSRQAVHVGYAMGFNVEIVALEGGAT